MCGEGMQDAGELPAGEHEALRRRLETAGAGEADGVALRGMPQRQKGLLSGRADAQWTIGEDRTVV
ncbi:MAG: hypothetical protein ACTHN5_09920 [Phycisphaerae bacterium]